MNYKKIPMNMKMMLSLLKSTRVGMTRAERKAFNKWFALEQFKAAADTLPIDELVDLKAEIVTMTKQREEYEELKAEPKKRTIKRGQMNGYYVK